MSRLYSCSLGLLGVFLFCNTVVGQSQIYRDPCTYWGTHDYGYGTADLIKKRDQTGTQSRFAILQNSGATPTASGMLKVLITQGVGSAPSVSVVEQNVTGTLTVVEDNDGSYYPGSDFDEISEDLAAASEAGVSTDSGSSITTAVGDPVVLAKRIGIGLRNVSYEITVHMNCQGYEWDEVVASCSLGVYNPVEEKFYTYKIR